MIKEKTAKLINVKSIITILLTLSFCFLTTAGKPVPEELKTIYTVIISFFFGTQLEKRRGEEIHENTDK